MSRRWLHDALLCLEQEAARSADTHLLPLDLPALPGIRFLFKDEAAHPTGSLKHRLARSLFLYALCNGRLQGGQSVIDASSGSTAISEAWFARLLGLRFSAVMPEATAPGKVRLIRALGADCVLVPTGIDASEGAGECGSVVSLLCDRGDCYDETLYDPCWLAGQGIDPEAGLAGIAALEAA